MRTLNRVTLIGHLAADPEIRQTKSGIAVATFAVATNRGVKKNDGEKRETADFHRIVAWRGLAEVCAQYIVKGSAVYLEGHIINNSFEDKDGNKHYKTEIVADRVDILTWKKSKNEKVISQNNNSEKAGKEKELVDA